MDTAKTMDHQTERELAEFLAGVSSKNDKKLIRSHIAGCAECLAVTVSAYESIKAFSGKNAAKRRKGRIMDKLNLYLILAAASFILSFMIPHYFLQLLVATLVLGAKWVADSKSTKMLVMIYEAWKKGGEKETSRILRTLNKRNAQSFQLESPPKEND